MIHASRILVPIKGNPSDVEVLELACEIARKSKAQIYAIHVIEVKRTLPLDAELQEEAERVRTCSTRPNRSASALA